MTGPKSLSISCSVSNFYGIEIEIWVGFGPVGITEKNWVDYELIFRGVFRNNDLKKIKTIFPVKT